MDYIVRGVAKNRTRLSNFHFHYTKEDQSNGDVDSRSIFFFHKMADILPCLHFDEHDQVKKQRLVMQNLGENCRKEVYLSSIGQGGWDPEQIVSLGRKHRQFIHPLTLFRSLLRHIRDVFAEHPSQNRTLPMDHSFAFLCNPFPV